MTEITIRVRTDKSDIDPSFFVNLDRLAKKYDLQVRHSAQSAIDPSGIDHNLSHDEFIRRAIEISRKIGPIQSDSAVDIREMRDSR